MLDRQLLGDSLRLAPEQPATALWRAIEIGHLLQSAALPVNGRGLDLGCGNGGVTRLVLDHSGASWQLVGVDPDPGEVALARESGIYDTVLESTGDAIQVGDEAFDFVFSNSVLEHVDQLEPTLREVGRVLKFGGLFVFTVPSPSFADNLGHPGLIGRIATGASDVSSYRAAIDRRLAHRRYLTVDEWRAALASVGLELRDTSVYMSRAETRRCVLLSNLTAGLLVRITRGTRSPLELQRELGLRRSSPPFWLRAIGQTIGRLGAVGLDPDHGLPGRGSCLLVVAQRTSGSQ
jgi:SAM-dependent methyltransferase